MRKLKNIESIGYPNTVKDSDKTFYTAESGYDFELFYKDGEMARIGWIKITKDGRDVAEIKESVCDIYYKIDK